MLCNNCGTAIQAAAKQFRRTQGLSDSDVKPRLNSSFLHLSLCDFKHSVATGCYVCRHVEECLLTTGEVQLESGDENGVTYLMLLRLLRNIRARTVNWTIQHLLIPWTIYTATDLSKRLLNAAQQWCTKHYLFWISVEPSLEIRVRPLGFEGWYNTLPGLGSLYGPGIVQGETYIDFLLSPILYDGANVSPETNSNRQALSHWTGDSTALWHYWLNTCLASHPTCRSVQQSLQAYSPKTLVEILPNNDGSVSGWNLAYSSRTGTVPYFTLSHCWGSHLPLSLTKDNVRSLSNPSSVYDLPKTYQDALTVVNSLGYKYIWIDSLCIVQDDEQDWENESSLMGFTYHHAVCNIAATWAINGEEGCFSTRDPTRVCPTFIALDLTASGPSTYQISQSGDSAYHKDITRAPLNKRGWVVQERYLARRQLSATKCQFYWECHDLLASEEFRCGYPADASANSEWPWRFGAAQCPQKPSLDFNRGKQTRQDWAALVELYSACHLSRASDKLAALSGLANQLQNIVDDIYMFGLWKKDLHQQLCWRPAHLSETPRRTTQGLIAPTWSWVNFDGPVDFDTAYYGTYHEYLSWIEVVDTPSNLTKKLTLRGLALKSRLVWKYREYHPGWGRNESHLSLDGLAPLDIPESSDKLVLIRWDEEMSQDDVDSEQWSNFQEQRNSDLLFLVVNSIRCVTGQQVFGLVLRRLPPSAGDPVLYYRMGTFLLDDHGDHVLGHLVSQLNLRTSDTEDSLTAELIQNVTIV